jgi:hypothetical protein
MREIGERGSEIDKGRWVDGRMDGLRAETTETRRVMEIDEAEKAG